MRIKKEKRQGLGQWHIEKQHKVKIRLLDYLKEIDFYEINDSRRGVRAISKKTKIAVSTLAKILSEKPNDILVVKGENRRKLLCIKSQENETRIKHYEIEKGIKKLEKGKVKPKLDKEKYEFKKEIAMLQQTITYGLKKTNENSMNYSDYNSDAVKLERRKIESVLSAYEIIKYLLDDRRSLLPRMRPFLVALTSLMTTSAAAKKIGLIREKMFLDLPNRINQIRTIATYQQFIEFIQKDPWNWGYSPIPCPKCDKFALKLQMHLDGTWDLVCKNLAAHDNQELNIPASYYKEYENDLQVNKNGLAEKYIERFGIEV